MSNSRRSHRRSSKRSSIAPIGAYTRQTNRNNYNDNTWVVFKNSTVRTALLFDGSLTRDEVRCAYTRETGVRFVNTRSRRLENYGRRSK